MHKNLSMCKLHMTPKLSKSSEDCLLLNISKRLGYFICH